LGSTSHRYQGTTIYMYAHTRICEFMNNNSFYSVAYSLPGIFWKPKLTGKSCDIDNITITITNFYAMIDYISTNTWGKIKIKVTRTKECVVFSS
jgi:hypothetical protein